MGSVFANPYVFGFLIALLTAGLVYAYQQSVEPDQEVNKRTFFKVLAAGVLAAIIMTYLVHRPQPPISTEPFVADMSIPSTTPAS